MKWPFLSRKKVLRYFDLQTAMACSAIRSVKTMTEMRLIKAATEIQRLKRENDLLKWRLQEIDPDFVREVEETAGDSKQGEVVMMELKVNRSGVA